MGIKDSVSPQSMAILLAPGIHGAKRAKSAFTEDSNPLTMYKGGVTLALEDYITAVALAFIPDKTNLFSGGVTLADTQGAKKDIVKLRAFKRAFLNDVFNSLDFYYSLLKPNQDFRFTIRTSSDDVITRNLTLRKKRLVEQMRIYKEESLGETSAEFRNLIFQMRTPLLVDSEVTDILALMFVLSEDKDKDEFYNYM